VSQPLTHYFVAKNALVDTASDLIRAYETYLGFGSFGPDLFYLTKHGGYADMIHADGSLDAFCVMLDMVKNNWNVNYDAAGKQLAFAMGFYAHVITDCVFHPYVYRLSQDYWAVPKPEHLAKYENMHKVVEAVIDHHLLDSVIHPNLRISFGVDCGHELDPAVSELIHGALNTVYGQSLDYGFQTTPPSDPGHLINQAYSRFRVASSALYGVQNVLYRIDEIIDAAATLTHTNADAVDLSMKPWPPGGLSGNINLTFDQLYGKAVNAVARIVGPVYGYLGSDYGSAREFLAASGGLHLTENWNLDTGLPAAWNTRQDLFAQDDTRYDVGVNEVLEPVFQQLG
jgi:hypothetical protein